MMEWVVANQNLGSFRLEVLDLPMLSRSVKRTVKMEGCPSIRSIGFSQGDLIGWFPIYTFWGEAHFARMEPSASTDWFQRGVDVQSPSRVR